MHSINSTTAGLQLKAGQRQDLKGRHLVVRADASAALGLGHAMRCLSLAQGWLDAGGTACLVSENPPEPIVRRWAAEGIKVTSPERYEASTARPADWVVLDGPHSAEISTTAPILLIDDDGGRTQYPCDLLLNQNAGADPGLYAGKTDARLLLGPSHALLRREIRAWRNWQRPIEARVENLLITFGGSDPGHHTERALDALALLPPDMNMTIRVLVGGGNPRVEHLRERVGRLPFVDLIHDTENMGTLIRESDLVLSAAGSTLWELAVLATPMLIGAAVPVELGPAQAMAKRNAAIDLGPLDQISTEALAASILDLTTNRATRTALSVAARRVVDGGGIDRVLDALADGLTSA